MKGTYILVIHLSKDCKIPIGALGDIQFKQGHYLYVGSAMAESGSGTLINRIKRHVKEANEKKMHWHVDYLLNHKSANIERLILIPHNQRLECLIAGELNDCSDGNFNNFGSSDCDCHSHLFYFENYKNSCKLP